MYRADSILFFFSLTLRR